MPILRATPAIEAIPPMTPFIGPEQLMREGSHARLLRLGANESAFGPSPKAVAAMSAELPHLSWYGDPESFALREALAARFGCSLENVCVGSGIDDLMGLVVRAFIGPGSVALATRGTYPTFAYHVTGFGGGLATVDYRADGFVDVDALIRRTKSLRPSIVYLANPDNPSGTLLERGKVERLFDALPAQTLLLLDEAYADFVEAEAFLGPMIHSQLVRVRTFSKAYGMAGARIGFAITTPRNVATFQKIRLHYGVNRNAQVGAMAALEDDAFVAHVVQEVARGRDDYYSLAASLGLGTIPSHTNFVCIDCGDGRTATALMETLLRRGVFIRKPALPPLEGYVRVTVGTPEERAQFAEHFRAVISG
ncbi:MAG: aminotransferase class I/II-fold pyridoxal phosphate-dependent enzyme [Candidatus Eremiobacteraeota bacterium]|nr:aminotransferase class I/II-fold pyridoxal phosphate-dependent enzyme [Candidatus Eremiobacteraeota bacterium]